MTEANKTASQRYAEAGVDIAAAATFVDRVKRAVARASRPEVLAGVGPFSSAFALRGYREPVLVSSVDGVGTKLKLATLLGRYDTVGQDLVNHSVNDVLASGAEPLFFLDYIGSNGVSDDARLQLVEGMANACAANGCALVGGETADLPGVYAPGDFDLVGTIVGVAERDALIDGSRIAPGDALVALPSTGLHTNGYSLVRALFGVGMGGDPAAERATMERVEPELGTTLGDALMAVHRSYLRELRPFLSRIHGIAHITGGGLPGNIPRMLPEGVAARVEWGSWDVPPLFRLIQRTGDISLDEMIEVFNMGLGVIVAVASSDAEVMLAALPDAIRVGEIRPRGPGDPAFVLAGSDS